MSRRPIYYYYINTILNSLNIYYVHYTYYIVIVVVVVVIFNIRLDKTVYGYNRSYIHVYSRIKMYTLYDLEQFADLLYPIRITCCSVFARTFLYIHNIYLLIIMQIQGQWHIITIQNKNKFDIPSTIIEQMRQHKYCNKKCWNRSHLFYIYSKIIWNNEFDYLRVETQSQFGKWILCNK